MRRLNRLLAFFVAAILSLPMASVALGVADKVAMPTWVRWLVSPGYYPGLWYQPSHPSAGLIQGLQNFATDLSHSISIELFLNCLYYGAFLYIFLRRFLALPDWLSLKGNPDAFWRRPQ
jgi:hypothetical protein